MPVSKGQLEKDIEFSTTHITIVYRWLLAQGYSKKSLLSNHSITEDVLDNTESHTSFYLQHQFIVNALTLTDNELLGLEIGHYIATQSPGLLGYAVKCSPTLNIALDMLSQHFQLRNALFTLKKVQKKDVCLLTFNETIEFEQARNFLYLMFISACITLFKETINYDLAIKSVSLTIDKPINWDNSLYSGITFYFNAQVNYIAFDAHHLEGKISSSDPLTLQNLQEYFALKSLERVDEGFINQVRRVITKHLIHAPSQDDVASELGISTRSLRRKLQEHDVTYKDILNTVRAEKAIRLLKDNKLRIYQICEKMGYNNLSNFRRAFKTWTGKSFKHFR